MKLVLISNTNTCKLYHYEKKPAKLKLLKEISHPESRLKTSELISDRAGRYKARATAHGAYSPPFDAKEIEIDNFSREIARALNQERTQNRYDELIVIVPPHMNGLLSQHLNKQVKDMIINNITKDVLHLNDNDLLDFLQTNTKYPGK